MPALFIYYLLLSDIDIPYVTVSGLAALTVAIGSSLFYFSVSCLLASRAGLNLISQRHYQDMLFFFSAYIIVTILAVNSDLAYNQALDYAECTYIFLMFYLIMFRAIHWKK